MGNVSAIMQHKQSIFILFYFSDTTPAGALRRKRAWSQLVHAPAPGG